MQQLSKLVRKGRGAGASASVSSNENGRIGMVEIRRPVEWQESSPYRQVPSAGGRLGEAMGPNGSGKALLDIIVLGLKLYAKHRGVP